MPSTAIDIRFHISLVVSLHVSSLQLYAKQIWLCFMNVCLICLKFTSRSPLVMQASSTRNCRSSTLLFLFKSQSVSNPRIHYQSNYKWICMFNQIDGNISVQTLYSGYQSTSIVFSEALFLVQGASIPPLPKSLLSPFTSLLCSALSLFYLFSSSSWFSSSTLSLSAASTSVRRLSILASLSMTYCRRPV